MQPPFEPGEIITPDGVRVLRAPDRGAATIHGRAGGLAPMPLALMALTAAPVLAAAVASFAGLAAAATGIEVARRLLRPWAGGGRAGTVRITVIEVRW